MEQSPAFAVQSLRTILATYRVDYVLASARYGAHAVQGLVQATPPELRVVRRLPTGAIFVPVQGSRSTPSADAAASPQATDTRVTR